MSSLSTVASAASLAASFAAVVEGLEDDMTRLSSLASVRSCLAASSGSSSEENSDPNTRSLPDEKRTDTVSRLVQIEKTVRALELKARELSSVVASERAAEKSLQKVRSAALEQLAEIKLVRDNLPATLPPPPSPTPSPSPLSPSASSLAPSASHSTSSSPVPSLASVSLSEFEAVNKATRGRLTLQALNAAVNDINAVAFKKHSALQTASKKGARAGTNLYMDAVIKLSEETVSDHAGRFFVAERELRDDCAFFRAGEATAKCSLAVLRSLGRLRQVQGGNNQVTYVVL